MHGIRGDTRNTAKEASSFNANTNFICYLALYITEMETKFLLVKDVFKKAFKRNSPASCLGQKF